MNTSAINTTQVYVSDSGQADKEKLAENNAGRATAQSAWYKDWKAGLVEARERRGTESFSATTPVARFLSKMSSMSVQDDSEQAQSGLQFKTLKELVKPAPPEPDDASKPGAQKTDRKALVPGVTAPNGKVHHSKKKSFVGTGKSKVSEAGKQERGEPLLIFNAGEMVVRGTSPTGSIDTVKSDFAAKLLEVKWGESKGSGGWSRRDSVAREDWLATQGSSLTR